MMDQETPGFRLGPIYSGYVAIEGDGSRVIIEDDVHVEVDPTMVELPDDLERRRAEIEAALPNEQDQPFWEAPRYAVVSCRPGRFGDQEDPEVWLRLQHSTYLKFLATQQVDLPFSDGSTPRSRYLSCRSIPDMPAFMANSFGAHIAVVTADRRMVVVQRGHGLAVQPGLWSASVSEGLSRGLDGPDGAAPSIFALARRGLDEELRVDADEGTLELLSVGLCTTIHQWVALFVIRLYELTYDELADRLSRGSADPWELAQCEAVQFDPEVLLRYLIRPDRATRWTPAGPPAFYYALVREFGRATVDRTLERILRAEL